MATDARVAKSRAKFREALLVLVQDQKLESITVSDIVEQAGVGYATFFRHYASKMDLWHEITDRLNNEILERIAPFVDEPDTLLVSEALCAFVVDNRDALSAILAQGSEGAVREDMVRRTADLAATRTKRRLNGLPRDLAIIHSINATIGILAWWMEHYESVTPKQMAEIIDRLVSRPLRQEKADC
jgi:AcrR family transcriptional regulator